MKPTILTQHKNIAAICLAEFLVLFIPFIAMKLHLGFNWTIVDFIVAGSLVAFFGIAYILISRRLPKYKLAIGIGIALAFMYLWAELAVGIFFKLGS